MSRKQKIWLTVAGVFVVIFITRDATGASKVFKALWNVGADIFSGFGDFLGHLFS